MNLRKHLLIRDFLVVVSLVAGRQWLMLIPIVLLLIYDAVRKDADL